MCRIWTARSRSQPGPPVFSPVTVWLVTKRELKGGLADACGGLSPRRLFCLSRSCILSS